MQDAQKHELLARHQEPQRDVERVLAELAQHQKERSAEVEKMKRMIEEHLKTNCTIAPRRWKSQARDGRAPPGHPAGSRKRSGDAEARANLAPVEGPAAAGDVLEVRIGGEPDLPTHYDIRGDGTIRLPFLGSFKVVGQTAAQVQAAIGKQIADRKLGPANQVTVSVLRAR